MSMGLGWQALFRIGNQSVARNGLKRVLTTLEINATHARHNLSQNEGAAKKMGDIKTMI